MEVCTDITAFFNGADSWGDGWNGQRTPSVHQMALSYTLVVLKLDPHLLMNFALLSGTYSLFVGGGSYDSEISWSITNEAGETMAAGGAGEFSVNIGGPDDVFGCTDATALNYDEAATVDNGTCYYVGDICESPLTASAGLNNTSGVSDQWFSYTPLLMVM